MLTAWIKFARHTLAIILGLFIAPITLTYELIRYVIKELQNKYDH